MAIENKIIENKIYDMRALLSFFKDRNYTYLRVCDALLIIAPSMTGVFNIEHSPHFPPYLNIKKMTEQCISYINIPVNLYAISQATPNSCYKIVSEENYNSCNTEKYTFKFPESRPPIFIIRDTQDNLSYLLKYFQ
jgi:hypothetical protein